MDIQVENIIKQVCKDYGVDLHDVLDRNRKVEIVEARNEAMLRLNLKLKMSASAIGRIFKKTHASVLHAWNEAEKTRANKVNINAVVEGLLAERSKLLKRVGVIDDLIKSYN